MWTVLSHPHPREPDPAPPTGWSFGRQLGSYLFFFLIYKTCKRRSSVKWPRKEALMDPAVPRDKGHAEADEQETVSPQVLRDPYILQGASL